MSIFLPLAVKYRSVLSVVSQKELPKIVIASLAVLAVFKALICSKSTGFVCAGFVRQPSVLPSIIFANCEPFGMEFKGLWNAR